MKKLTTSIMLAAFSAAALAQEVPVPDSVAAAQEAAAAQAEAEAAAQQQGMTGGAPADEFPPAPAQQQTQSQADVQRKLDEAAAAAIQNGQVSADGTTVTINGTSLPSNNGVAPMPPLTPPETTDYQHAEKLVAPYTQEEVVNLRKRLDTTRKAKAAKPLRSVPRISSISVDLSPGAELPIARVLPGEVTTLVFVDSTGAPWPLAVAPRISDPRFFDVEWLKDTASVVISALSGYEEGNITVFLVGMATPVMVKLATGEPDSKKATRIVDYRLDLRIPGRGPNAQAAVYGSGRVSLYDDTMQAFLDGVPPKDARIVAISGGIAPARLQVWQYGQDLFVRTQNDIQTAFDQSMFAADGTRIYRLPLTPYITLSEAGGASVTLQLDIH